ncbi:Protein of unknown function [Propionibacterium freudenreichii]|uniref:Uncharacterized protein n=1 Tax=Propionibacterium freudenreichii subsp. shermanii (strain ATCC 9614 / DSM 4902 / CIP 103027 / NCIMB 8099 / CIRM-BIA1) TaxID=754252 RepID=D7GHY9_PROFC|nr:Hypothetical protein PFREUD_01960 [Propionibacterium freudenreichii subsp. shermanii CIRM-BIA1]CDP48111.1 protein of unknown function [Propionibacterium freudenreichii subsp. freudenreichii]CEG87852.1 Protein of unknown function [Propionibacterium freudenreichii]CEG95030.1 protein of unknown function [Propionibacterium freudenreichii]CEH08398.1 Protein of unknown function [Propionibacterium freudenreichii]
MRQSTLDIDDLRRRRSLVITRQEAAKPSASIPAPSR